MKVAHISHQSLFDMIAPQECWTVHDSAGLEALPVGTKLLDRDGDPWAVIADGIFQVDDASTYDASTYDAFEFEPEWLPLEILNPEVLGEFDPEHDVANPLRPGDASEHRGRVVVVVDRGVAGSRWTGLRAEVVNWNYGYTSALLKPLQDRPDRYRREEFTWPREFLAFIDQPTAAEELAVPPPMRMEALAHADRAYLSQPEHASRAQRVAAVVDAVLDFLASGKRDERFAKYDDRAA